MATGDIKSVAVNADGWSVDVVIDGWAGKQGLIAYDFGSFDDVPALATDPRIAFHVVSEGYDTAGVLGTRSRTVYGTHVVRRPYNLEAQKDEDDSGADLVVRVSLSDSIYNDDRDGGAGTSGTNPTVTIAAGWATEGANQSAAVLGPIGMACTNNSTLDYPKCIAQWAWGHTPAFRRVAAEFSIGVIAYHGHGVSCCNLSATDAHAAAVSGTVTAKTDHAMSASGLHYESYDLAVPVTSFTEGDDITLRYIAYPQVGDADSIIDTSVNTTASEVSRGYNQITCTYKTTGISTKYVADAGRSGSDANSGNTAVAPYLTIGKALEAGADEVLIVNGSTLDMLGKTPSGVPVKNYFVEVKPDVGATVALTRGAFTAYGTKRLAYIGIQSITYVSGSGWLDGGGGDRIVWFENCAVSGATGLTVGLAYRSYGCWAVNCTVGSDKYGAWGTDNYHFSFTGCDLVPTTAGGMVSQSHVGLVACKADGGGSADRVKFAEKQPSAALPNAVNVLIANNKFINCAVSGGDMVHYGSTFPVDGLAFVGNVIESRSGAQPLAWFGADGGTVSINNLIFAHNTIVGERCNLFYNDTGTAANVRTNVFFRNNALNGFAIKSDTFGTQNGSRVGNWAQMNGVNTSDNRYTYQSGLNTFVCDYPGINVQYEDTGASVPNEMGFADDNSAYGDGTGNGDYTPALASVLNDHAAQQVYQSYDLYGVAR